MNCARFFILLAMLIAPLSRAAQVSINWQGLSTGTSTAVDPHGAAGPQGILEVANQGITYYSRLGTQYWRTNEQGFFLPSVCCDAKAIYDPDSRRFFVIAQPLMGTNSTTSSNLFINVSRTSDPLTAGPNDWFRYRIYLGFDIDYPGIGIDAQGLYVTYGSGFRKFIIVRKADLLTNAANPYLVFGTTPPVDFTSQGLQAVSVVGSASPGNVAYAVTFSATNRIALSAMTDPIGPQAALWSTNIPAPSVGNPGNVLLAPQLATSVRLNASMSSVAMGNAFWREGELWFCGVAASSNQPERTLVRWYKLNTGGYPSGQSSLAEWGELDGGPHTWRQHPSIAGNARGDVCLVFTQTSSNAFSSMIAAIRKPGQSAFEEVLVRQSPASYAINQTTNPVSPSARWADYSVVTPDPLDQSFWVSHLTLTNLNAVSTWWGNINRDRAIYVNLFNAFPVKIGTYAFPFTTVREAHAIASGGETILIFPTFYNEAPLPRRFDKRVRLENPYGGVVHLGP